jgi:hypothetical protein
MVIKTQRETRNAPPTRTLFVESSGGSMGCSDDAMEVAKEVIIITATVKAIVVDEDEEIWGTKLWASDITIIVEEEDEDPKLRLCICITLDGEGMVTIV